MRDTFGSTDTAVLFAVMRLPRPTVRAVADEVGRSVATTHLHLERLKTAGLVSWDKGKRGSLRATVRPVPFGVAA